MVRRENKNLGHSRGWQGPFPISLFSFICTYLSATNTPTPLPHIKLASTERGKGLLPFSPYIKYSTAEVKGPSTISSLNKAGFYRAWQGSFTISSLNFFVLCTGSEEPFPTSLPTKIVFCIGRQGNFTISSIKKEKVSPLQGVTRAFYHFLPK